MTLQHDRHTVVVPTSPQLDMTPVAVAAHRWILHAECRDADPELFHPLDVKTPTSRAQISDAIDRYCDACPVRRYCAAYADRNRFPGVWGGTVRYTSASHYIHARPCADPRCAHLVRIHPEQINPPVRLIEAVAA